LESTGVVIERLKTSRRVVDTDEVGKERAGTAGRVVVAKGVGR